MKLRWGLEIVWINGYSFAECCQSVFGDLKSTAKRTGQSRKPRKENVDAIKAWRSALGPEPWHYRVHDAIKGTETTVDEIVQIMKGKYFF